MSNPQSAESYAAQIQALLSHDVADHLAAEIQTPTLVMHGEEDRMILRITAFVC